tara:strand:- start:260 stop:604 length:345 start_codon:yes stop_codon:yes gene_type:complete
VDEIKKAFNVLDDNGFMVCVPGMFTVTTAADAELYVKDKNKFYAKMYGLTLKDYMGWLEWERRCQGITKKGDRCKNPVIECWHSYPDEYDPKNLRQFHCKIHLPKEESDETQAV